MQERWRVIKVLKRKDKWSEYKYLILATLHKTRICVQTYGLFSIKILFKQNVLQAKYKASYATIVIYVIPIIIKRVETLLIETRNFNQKYIPLSLMLTKKPFGFCPENTCRFHQ